MIIDIFNTDKKYDLIYADPPWEYRQSGSKTNSRGMAKQHYKTMPTDAICKLPIRQVCKDTIQELRGYIDELHIKLEYDDYVNLINLVDEIEVQLSPQEDLREWVVDNFGAIENDVFKSITKFCKENAFNGRNADLSSIGDRYDLQAEICSNLKEGLLNVIDTYEA